MALRYHITVEVEPNNQFVRAGCIFCGQVFKLEDAIAVAWVDDAEDTRGQPMKSDICPQCVAAPDVHMRIEEHWRDLKRELAFVEELLRQPITFPPAEEWEKARATVASWYAESSLVEPTEAEYRALAGEPGDELSF